MNQDGYALVEIIVAFVIISWSLLSVFKSLYQVRLTQPDPDQKEYVSIRQSLQKKPDANRIQFNNKTARVIKHNKKTIGDGAWHTYQIRFSEQKIPIRFYTGTVPKIIKTVPAQP